MVPNFAYLSQTDCSIVISPAYYDEDIKYELLVNTISDKRVFTYWKGLVLEYFMGYSARGDLDMCNHCRGADAVNCPVKVAEQMS